MRRRGRVDGPQRAIVQALRQAGASVVDTSTVGGGFVDLVVGVAGHTWLVEIKDGAKRACDRPYTPAQQRFRELWRGEPAVTVLSVDDALLLVCIARKGAA